MANQSTTIQSILSEVLQIAQRDSTHAGYFRFREWVMDQLCTPESLQSVIQFIQKVSQHEISHHLMPPLYLHNLSMHLAMKQLAMLN